MVTGQSVILYSRLHLVTPEVTVLRGVKWMIIVDAIIFHGPVTMMLWGSHFGRLTTSFSDLYQVYEKIQMTGFCVQEFIISGIYLRDAIRLLRSLVHARTRRIMWQLFPVNVIIIAMDIFLLVLEYLDLRVLEQTSKGLIYSVKLKMEFAILGKLVEIVQSNSANVSRAFEDTSDSLDNPRKTSEAHAGWTMTGGGGEKIMVEQIEDKLTEDTSTSVKNDSSPKLYDEKVAPDRSTGAIISGVDVNHDDRDLILLDLSLK